MSYLFLILCFLIAPTAAFAYLDPGSGAVLINLLIAGIGALLFSLRGVFLRLIGKGDKIEKKQRDEYKEIAILSEGRQYFATFEPIVKALIKNKLEFAYFTLDIEDEILSLESPYMDARFLGYGSLGFHRAAKIRAKNLLCTTPNIGSKGYPIAKPAGVDNLIHVFHSINDLSMYRKGSLDHYDSVFMVGDFQKKSIRELEKKRGLQEKKLLALGIPYLDRYQEDAAGTKGEERGEVKTLLIASSWGAKGLFENYGIEFIKELAGAGYRVIVRPHPQSYASEPKAIAAIEHELKKSANIVWDREISPSRSMQKADLLISDTSSIRFDFAFLFQKPVITLDIAQQAMPGFEREDMNELWMDGAAGEIGVVLKPEEIKDIALRVEKMLSEYDSEKISQYRDQTISNFGFAGEAMAQYLAAKHGEEE